MSGTSANEFAAIHELSVPAELAGMRLDVVLARLLPQYSRARLQGWIDVGRVQIEGREASRRERVEAADRLRVQAEFPRD